uniref:Uncharacterized protein n=1 Tax=Rhizophora mucronata TaxID=61149 RepID=A0A2P2PUU4_RHIMU
MYSLLKRTRENFAPLHKLIFLVSLLAT